MEIELKYKLQTNEVAEEIWTDPFLILMEEEGSREEICINARYYDTEDCLLSKMNTAYRVRKECDRWTATIKGKGESQGALHKRLEINLPVEDGTPNPVIFKGTEISQETLDVLLNRKLFPVVQTKFIRRKFRVDIGRGIFEISIDKGNIITDEFKIPIFELEIELFSGEIEDLIEFGDKISGEYQLEKEEVSKYARGIALIKQARY